MRNAVNLLLICFFSFVAFAQSSSEQLKKEQKKLESKINNTKSLLTQVKNNQKASLNELKLIENQIKSREELVRVFDNQVRMAEVKMIERKNEIRRLNKRLEDLKTQYKRMILFAYKNRNNIGKIMFLLSADSYNEALKRNKYLQKVAGLQRKQRDLIRQHQSMIQTEIKEIDQEKASKLAALEEKKKEREQIQKDKGLKEKSYQKFKQDEQKLLAELKKDERKKEEVKAQINAAIKREIAENQRRQKEADEKARANAKSNKSNKKKNSSGTSTTPTDNSTTASNDEPKEEKKYVYTESPDGIALGKNFESSKGRLPWPVNSGTITEKYGRNAHPTLEGVFTNNNGIDITCTKGSSVRAVFEGEVSSVFSIPGAGKVVIIKHGSYRTVYSNLSETFVKTGTKVTTKQAIGQLLESDGNVSVCHFEVHSVNNSGTQSLNPSLWIGR